MALINDVTNELLLKVVYVGCHQSGKTTNIQSLYKQTSNEVTSRFFDLHAVKNQLPYFDFLPLSLGENRSQTLKLHLYTLPSSSSWRILRKQIIRGLDGLVWVIDSRAERLEENEYFFHELQKTLAETQTSLEHLPLVIQLNHRDAPSALSVQALKSVFARKSAYQIEAVAVQDIGVLETVEAMTDLLIQTMETQPRESARLARNSDAMHHPAGTDPVRAEHFPLDSQ